MNNLFVLLGIIGAIYYSSSSQNTTVAHIRVNDDLVSWKMNGIRENNCTNKSSYEEGIACTTCELITGAIKHDIKVSNDTISEVEKLVEALCKSLGTKPIAEECNTILADINIIVQLIERGFEPGNICCQLGFCNTTK